MKTEANQAVLAVQPSSQPQAGQGTLHLAAEQSAQVSSSFGISCALNRSLDERKDIKQELHLTFFQSFFSFQQFSSYLYFQKTGLLFLSHC